ncbi:MAG: HNH endonuclease [Desulfobulbaceae bacterium]|nr:HNH endonuclease [Desulfobulbaceae bacterium]
MNHELTYEEANRLFIYCPSTGRLFWRRRQSIRILPGGEAGSLVVLCNGYKRLTVRVNYRLYLVHRVIWLLLNKEWPRYEIDHINGNSLDNRPENLRDVFHSTNQKNMKIRVDNSSGVAGVAYDNRRSMWRARIVIDGHDRHLGYFKTMLGAVSARKDAERILGFTGRTK